MNMCIAGSYKWPEFKNGELVKAIKWAIRELDKSRIGHDHVHTLITSGTKTGVDKVVRDWFLPEGYIIQEVTIEGIHQNWATKQSIKMANACDAVLLVVSQGFGPQNNVYTECLKQGKPAMIYKDKYIHKQGESFLVE